MKRLLVCTIVCCTILTFPVFAQSTSPLRGMELYENHCTVCHTSQVHIREKRKAKSLDDIKAWVWRWARELKLAWTDEEVNEVRAYLNARYYQY